ncbi:MAG TPA: MG2 domain-containing protein, partial [Armatimonadota bacterium]|nr:MG2 domain-containing protein [Armatimonadota bacterium]
MALTDSHSNAVNLSGALANASKSARGLWIALAALFIAAAAAFVTSGLPPEGSVQGVCLDRATGRPLPHASVWLDRSASESDQPDGMSITSNEGDLFSASAGARWREQSRDDGSVDAAGANPNPRDYLETETNSAGRFSFSHVRAGVYNLGASDPAHEIEPSTVVVEEGRVEHRRLLLDRSRDILDFEAVMRQFMPGEKATLGLHGLVKRRKVQITVDRFDIDGAIAHAANQLITPPHPPYYGDEPAQWPGQFIRIRQWVRKLKQASAAGSFYDRVPLNSLSPGMYRVTAETVSENPVVSSVGWICVTRLGLVEKAYGTHVLAFVTDRSTGKPAAGVPVSIYDGINWLASVRTSPQGLARLSTAGASKESQGVLVALDRNSVAALGLELNSPGEMADNSDSSGAAALSAGSSDRTIRSFIYTDRPIYRPGQTVYLKGICRWFNSRSGYSLPASAPVSLEVRDAQDTLISHQFLTTNDMGSWNSSLALSPETLTGQYRVRATLGGQTQEGSFAVAAYRKPEYELTVTFDRKRYIRGDTIHATLHASYFFGAPLSGASVSYSVYQADDWSGEDDSANSDSADSSPDDGEGVSGEPTANRTIRLDAAGDARFSIPTRDGAGAGGSSTDNSEDSMDQTYTVIANVQDQSGQPVQGQASVVVAQGAFSLQTTASPGVCRPGTPVITSAEATNENGNPLAGQSLEIRAAYESWNGDTEKLSLLRTDRVKTSAGGIAKVTLTPSHAGLLMIRAVGTDRRGNRIASESDVWVTGDTDDDFPARYPDLSLVLDQKSYQAGATAHLLINTEQPGPTALITLEGATLYHAWAVPLKRRSTGFNVKLDPSFGAGVTLSVCCIHDGQYFSSSKNLNISDLARTLNIKVSGDRRRYYPGDPATLTIRTLNAAGRGVPAEVSVGVVDSAIYAIRPEPPQSITDAFQPVLSNLVQTNDSCEQVFLGDVDKGAANVKIRKVFPDTALWRPDVRTGPEGRAVISLKMPDTLTTWRVTCTGHTRGTAVGRSACNLVVNKDLLVRLEAPAFLIAGDSTTIAALVHNNTAVPLHVSLRLAAQGLRLQGVLDQTVDAAPGRPVKLSWTAESLKAGPVKIEAIVTAGSLSDGVEQTLIVIPHGANQDVWHSGAILHRATKTVTLDRGVIPEATWLDVRLSPTVISGILPALDYLSAYPYGSTDATTSILESNAILAGASRPGVGAIPLGAAQRATLDEESRRSLLRLYRFQHDDGGWGWWTTGSSDLFMTSDALWGLTLARDAGYALNSTVFNAAAGATARLASTARETWKPRWDDFSDLTFAALTLARAGRSDLSASNLRFVEARWAKYPDIQTYIDLAQMALAEQAAGFPGEAKASMDALWAGRRALGTLGAWTIQPHWPQAGRYQDTPDAETTAWALLAAETVTPDDPRIDGVARWLMANRTGDHWSSTRATGVAILALTGYVSRAHELQPDFSARLLVNGRLVRSLRFAADSIDQPDTLVRIPCSGLRAGRNEIVLDKVGQGRLYYSLDLRECRPVARPAPDPPFWKRIFERIFHPGREKVRSSPSGYRIRRIYYRLTSRRGFLWEDSTPARGTRFDPGDDILVRLIIDGVHPASHVMVEEPVPAGCVVSDVSGDDADEWNNWWDYTDVRENRVVFFIGDLTRGEHEIDYHLQARTTGVYDVMPGQLTGVFDPTLHALGPPNRIIVEKAG